MFGKLRFILGIRDVIKLAGAVGCRKARCRAGRWLAAVMLFAGAVSLSAGIAHAAIIVDTAFTNINQIESAANNPYFGPGTTLDAAAFNVTYGTSGINGNNGGAAAGGTLNGIGFQDLDLSVAQSGTGISVANALPGVTADYDFPALEDFTPRNLTSTVLAPGSGPDWQTAMNVTESNWYFSQDPTDHPSPSLTIYGLTPNEPVYVQMIGGQQGWNGNVFVTANGLDIGGGTTTTDWASNQTNYTAGLLGFTATTDTNGDLALGLSTNFYAGIAAIIVSESGAPVPALYFNVASGATTWSDSGTGWSTTSGGPYNQTWGTPYLANFEGTAGTVTVAGLISRVDGINFNVDGYTLNGGSITLSSTTSVNVISGTATINSTLIGGGLEKIGNGTLVLGGANAYTGATAINAGTLSFASGGLGASSSIVFGGGTLQWAAGNTQDVSANIAPIPTGITAEIDTNGNNVTFATGLSGGGNLTKIGNGLLALDGANTYSGATTVSAWHARLGQREQHRRGNARSSYRHDVRLYALGHDFRRIDTSPRYIDRRFGRHRPAGD